MYKEYLHYKNNKPFSWFDITTLLLVVVLTVLSILFFTAPAGKEVLIYQHGALIGRYQLTKDYDLMLSSENGEFNLISIKDGTVSIIKSNCENELCSAHSPIFQVNHQIVCAPHGLIITIVGDSDFDVFSGAIQ